MMAGHGGRASGSVGGPARHIPVLLAPVLAELKPAPGERHLDGTFGAGGYTRAILDAGASVIALDRDPTAIAGGAAMQAEYGERLRLVSSRFSALDAVAEEEGFAPLDGVVLDIGVSSMQIDEADRGFSFQKDGPLDMRMGGQGPSAADAVNRLKAGDLARVLSFLGEERQAGRIARAIEARRAEKPFETTLDLAAAVGRVVGRKPGDRIDPATRTFQALRIYVNDELGELARALIAAERVLKPGGRLVVVTFHSLEDRIVKRFLRERSTPPSGSRHLPDVATRPLSFASRNKAIEASESEAAENPRARSAKLRSAIRTDAAPLGDADPLAFADLPSLVSLSQVGA
ncbi:16S rRNA (cytosine(1402)-N(4))-methyltransferase RsmH [Antarcticirhabdus aurantiaca]|uniref:16S rRNA (Cytosine(1402)-N(4))-methyltransferase RsmH n=1 Tax=Antarcticirhabdus aurantiaca TaxID=2606717 RepID=A0ACD4NII9_9HYPH|nr:16S rRNA (cytosine(1402)-N(4))-methyltransferase RsmH [Antarcticirhabdus aurantiaca]WAJ26536.1 16S rRNA (cytosine(1402)-N(4))-methyltransferase RsmH [Jeongeuplla avenae]